MGHPSRTRRLFLQLPHLLIKFRQVHLFKKDESACSPEAGMGILQEILEKKNRTNRKGAKNAKEMRGWRTERDDGADTRSHVPCAILSLCSLTFLCALCSFSLRTLRLRSFSAFSSAFCSSCDSYQGAPSGAPVDSLLNAFRRRSIQRLKALIQAASTLSLKR